MNILEAIKSGKRFKRPIWQEYAEPQTEGIIEISKADLIAEDYEVKPDKPEYIVSSYLIDNEARPPKYIRVIDERLVEKLVSAIVHSYSDKEQVEAVVEYRRHVPVKK